MKNKKENEYSTRVNVSMPKYLLGELDAIAESHHLSRSALARLAIHRLVRNPGFIFAEELR